MQARGRGRGAARRGGGRGGHAAGQSNKASDSPAPTVSILTPIIPVQPDAKNHPPAAGNKGSAAKEVVGTNKDSSNPSDPGFQVKSFAELMAQKKKQKQAQQQQQQQQQEPEKSTPPAQDSAAAAATLQPAPAATPARIKLAVAAAPPAPQPTPIAAPAAAPVVPAAVEPPAAAPTAAAPVAPAPAPAPAQPPVAATPTIPPNASSEDKMALLRQSLLQRKKEKELKERELKEKELKEMREKIKALQDAKAAAAAAATAAAAASNNNKMDVDDGASATGATAAVPALTPAAATPGRPVNKRPADVAFGIDPASTATAAFPSTTGSALSAPSAPTVLTTIPMFGSSTTAPASAQQSAPSLTSVAAPAAPSTSDSGIKRPRIVRNPSDPSAALSSPQPAGSPILTSAGGVAPLNLFPAFGGSAFGLSNAASTGFGGFGTTSTVSSPFATSIFGQSTIAAAVPLPTTPLRTINPPPSQATPIQAAAALTPAVTPVTRQLRQPPNTPVTVATPTTPTLAVVTNPSIETAAASAISALSKTPTPASRTTPPTIRQPSSQAKPKTPTTTAPTIVRVRPPITPTTPAPLSQLPSSSSAINIPALPPLSFDESTIAKEKQRITSILPSAADSANGFKVNYVELDAWLTEIMNSQADLLPSGALTLSNGITLPFTLRDLAEKQLFESILLPLSGGVGGVAADKENIPHGFRINYVKLDEWINEVERAVQAEMKQMGIAVSTSQPMQV